MVLTLDPNTTALVLIDLQAGIAALPLAPASGLAVAGASARLARRVVAAGGTLVLVRVAFSPDGRDRPGGAVDEPMRVPPGGLPADFAEFVAPIAALAPHLVVTKRHWGAFGGTELDLQLRRRGIRTVLLGGIATNFGVESTAREAWQANYDVVVVADCCTSVAEDMHRFSLERVLPRVARVRVADEVAFG